MRHAATLKTETKRHELPREVAPVASEVGAPGPFARWTSREPQTRSILRIMAAFLFLLFGTATLFGFPAPIMPGGGTATFASQAWFAGFLQAFGGFLLLIGLFTRPVAFVLSGEMAVAYFIAHAPQGFWPVLNQGTNAVLFCFVFIYFSVAGPGPWSLDALRRKNRARTSN
jgi:putative oxidoreductase